MYIDDYEKICEWNPFIWTKLAAQINVKFQSGSKRNRLEGTTKEIKGSKKSSLSSLKKSEKWERTEADKSSFFEGEGGGRKKSVIDSIIVIHIIRI